MAALAAAFFLAATPAASAEDLLFPVDGAWLVVAGPPCPAPGNTHCDVAGEQYALDLVPLDPFGRPEDCAGRPVKSPTAGTVIEVHDTPGDKDAAGLANVNRVVIRRSPAEYIFLAHLLAGSIKVKPGDTVVAGQLLARCGVSGNAPGHDATHLHIHMQTTTDGFDPGAAPLRMKFGNVAARTPGGCVGVSELLQADVTC